MKKNKKCIVMLSGGLDSRLAIRIMQEQGFEVIALFFNLPFGTGCCDKKCSFNFSQLSGVEMKIFDCSEGKLLEEYLEVLKNPKFNTGAGVNPCIDCRVFMFKKAREFADEQGIELIVTGEVLGERPMSQHRKALDIVEEESGLKGRLLRPLSAKLLPETLSEKKGLVKREKLYSIHGRQRKEQIELANKFKISYPNPGGGCLLCEKALKKRFNYLIKRGMNEKEIKLVGIGRHFLIDKTWVILGRNEKENYIIEQLGIKEVIVPENNKIGPSALVIGKTNEKIKDKVRNLIKAYSKGMDLKDRLSFEKYKL